MEVLACSLRLLTAPSRPAMQGKPSRDSGLGDSAQTGWELTRLKHSSCTRSGKEIPARQRLSTPHSLGGSVLRALSFSPSLELSTLLTGVVGGRFPGRGTSLKRRSQQNKKTHEKVPENLLSAGELPKFSRDCFPVDEPQTAGTARLCSPAPTRVRPGGLC